MTRREALNFDDVAALVLQRSGHFIESVLGVLAQHRLSGLEKNFGLGGGLVLIDVGDHLLDRVQTRVSLLRGLLRGLRLVAGLDGMLIGFAGLGRSELDSLLRARIGILDRPGVGGSQLIEFVDAVADWLRLPRDIFLARERIQVTPEAFASLRLQGIFAGGAVGPGGRLGRGLRGRRLSLGSGTLLRENWHSQGYGQQQSEDGGAVFHFKLPPSGEWKVHSGRLTARFDCVVSITDP